MKTYIGISRDHSASMRGIANEAQNDFNQNIASIQEASANLDTVVSVVRSGVGIRALCEWETRNSSVTALKPIQSYVADGHGTPLYDSVGMLIENLESMPDANDPTVSFVVMVVTDGLENRSAKWSGHRLSEKIRALQGTDRWTFVFRVPKERNGAYRENLIRNLNLFPGNVQEWDVSAAGMVASTKSTKESFKGFFAARTNGQTATEKFFVDLSDVKPHQIKENLEDITSEVQIIRSRNGGQIRNAVQEEGFTFEKGAAFYELLKTEEVQDHKQIVIKHRKSGKAYSGAAARNLLGLPANGTAKLAPKKTGQYDVYVQSTSVNRTIPANGRILILD